MVTYRLGAHTAGSGGPGKVLTLSTEPLRQRLEKEEKEEEEDSAQKKMGQGDHHGTVSRRRQEEEEEEEEEVTPTVSPSSTTVSPSPRTKAAQGAGLGCPANRKTGTDTTSPSSSTAAAAAATAGPVPLRYFKGQLIAEKFTFPSHPGEKVMCIGKLARVDFSKEQEPYYVRFDNGRKFWVGGERIQQGLELRERNFSSDKEPLNSGLLYFKKGPGVLRSEKSGQVAPAVDGNDRNGRDGQQGGSAASSTTSSSTSSTTPSTASPSASSSSSTAEPVLLTGSELVGRPIGVWSKRIPGYVGQPVYCKGRVVEYDPNRASSDQEHYRIEFNGQSHWVSEKAIRVCMDRYERRYTADGGNCGHYAEGGGGPATSSVSASSSALSSSSSSSSVGFFRSASSSLRQEDHIGKLPSSSTTTSGARKAPAEVRVSSRTTPVPSARANTSSSSSSTSASAASSSSSRGAKPVMLRGSALVGQRYAASFYLPGGQEDTRLGTVMEYDPGKARYEGKAYQVQFDFGQTHWVGEQSVHKGMQQAAAVDGNGGASPSCSSTASASPSSSSSSSVARLSSASPSTRKENNMRPQPNQHERGTELTAGAHKTSATAASKTKAKGKVISHGKDKLSGKLASPSTSRPTASDQELGKRKAVDSGEGRNPKRRLPALSSTSALPPLDLSVFNALKDLNVVEEFRKMKGYEDELVKVTGEVKCLDATRIREGVSAFKVLHGTTSGRQDVRLFDVECEDRDVVRMSLGEVVECSVTYHGDFDAEGRMRPTPTPCLIYSREYGQVIEYGGILGRPPPPPPTGGGAGGPFVEPEVAEALEKEVRSRSGKMKCKADDKEVRGASGARSSLLTSKGRGVAAVIERLRLKRNFPDEVIAMMAWGSTGYLMYPGFLVEGQMVEVWCESLRKYYHAVIKCIQDDLLDTAADGVYRRVTLDSLALKKKGTEAVDVHLNYTGTPVKDLCAPGTHLKWKYPDNGSSSVSSGAFTFLPA